MSDDNLPDRYRSRVPGAVQPASKPRKSYLSARVAEAEARANLRFELVEREREENNARFIDEQRRSALAQHELDTVDQDKMLLDAQRADDLARLTASTRAAVTSANAEISNFEALQAENNARAAEARMSEARSNEAAKKINDRMNAAQGDAEARIAAQEEQLKSHTIKLFEIEDQLAGLRQELDNGDPAAEAKLRALRAEHAMQKDKVDRVRRQIEKLSGLEE